VDKANVTILCNVDDTHKSKCNLLAELIRQIKMSDEANSWQFSVKLDEQGRAVLLGHFADVDVVTARVRVPQLIDCGCNTTVGAVHGEWTGTSFDDVQNALREPRH
jgi:hypothetical protein